MSEERTHYPTCSKISFYPSITIHFLVIQFAVLWHIVILTCIATETGSFCPVPGLTLQEVVFSIHRVAGIILKDYGLQWRSLRRFTLQVLRDFGVGKTSIEDKILTEISETSAQLEKLEGEPININLNLQNIIFNVVYGIVFGRR